MTARRYAEGTRVAVDQSRLEIERLVKRHGADEFGTWSTKETSSVQWSIGPWKVRLTLPMCTPKTARREPQPYDEREQRRRWRSLLAVIKAKLAAVQDGIVTFEQEFLPHLVKADGQTMYEAITTIGLGGIVHRQLAAGDL